MLALLLLAPPSLAGTTTSFAAGSIIIPMDAALQDDGILDAYGLVYALLQEGIPVHWVVSSSKAASGDDLSGLSSYLTTAKASTAASRDFAGGPFVVDAADAVDALLVVQDWQAAGWSAVAYYSDSAFTAEVSRTLFAAPSIAIFEDGREDIAWAYLNAAGIPDFDGNAWDASSPYNLWHS